MRLPPGSFLWLVQHDLRLAWRGVGGMVAGMRAAVLVPLLVLAVLTVHILAWPLVDALDPVLHGHSAGISSIIAILGATFTWMLAQGIFGLTRALYQRSDLDLLLGSPLPAGRAIAAKAVAIALSSFGSVAILALPIAHTGTLRGGPHWLGLYPLLIAFALLATAVGLMLVVGLFVIAGARRARLLAHLIAAVAAGAFVLGAQVVAMLPVEWRTSITDWVDSSVHEHVAGIGSLIWVPVATSRGDPVAALLLTLLAVLAFGGVVAGLGGRFAAASLAAAGAESGRGAWRSGRARVFQSGLGESLRRKEWLLLRRDPSFFAQLALQIVYTIPIAVVLVRSETLSLTLSLGPTIVMIAAQVAGSIAWITVSGEDAPELIASAPVTEGAVARAKLGAVAIPVLGLLVAPALGLAIVGSVPSALVVLLFAAMAAVSTVLLNFWHPMPGNRRGMLRRHSQSKLVGLVEHGLAMLWAFAVVFALIGTFIVLVPLALIAGVMVLSRRLGRGSAPPSTAAPVEALPTTA